MPIKIVASDVINIKSDAIVNPIARRSSPFINANMKLYQTAGPELFADCERMGEVPLGKAFITPGYNLSFKYVIHTAVPRWRGGASDEQALWRSCYAEALSLAAEYSCESVVISFSVKELYGYPIDKAVQLAADVVDCFLAEHEMLVYFVICDRSSYRIEQDIYTDVQTYIDNIYINEPYFTSATFCESSRRAPFICSESVRSASGEPREKQLDLSEEPEAYPEFCKVNSPAISATLDNMLKNLDKSFAQTLFDYIDKKGISDVDAYKRSNVTRKVFSKIKCDKNYRPSKITAISFAIGLRLDIEETRHLLSTAGLALSRADKFDVIIEYFIVSGKYKNIFDVNNVLYQFDQMTLGV